MSRENSRLQTHAIIAPFALNQVTKKTKTCLTDSIATIKNQQKSKAVVI